jgi:hypothetical protein
MTREDVGLGSRYVPANPAGNANAVQRIRWGVGGRGWDGGLDLQNELRCGARRNKRPTRLAGRSSRHQQGVSQSSGQQVPGVHVLRGRGDLAAHVPAVPSLRGCQGGAQGGGG